MKSRKMALSERTTAQSGNLATDAPDPALKESAIGWIGLIWLGAEAEYGVLPLLADMGLAAGPDGWESEADRAVLVALIEYSAAEGTPAVRRAAKAQLSALKLKARRTGQAVVPSGSPAPRHQRPKAA